MKYYLDGYLVKESKTTTYTHAVVFAGINPASANVRAYCSSYYLAKKELRRQTSHLAQRIENARRMIKAIDEGKRCALQDRDGQTFTAEITLTRAELLAVIAQSKEIKARYSIRELERNDIKNGKP